MIRSVSGPEIEESVPMVDVTIRGAEISDAEILPEIERSAGQAFRKIPDLGWIADGDDRSAEWHRRLIIQGACLVAVNGDNQQVGFLSAEVLSGDLHIWELSVLHDLQRSGIGRRLVESAIDKARMHKLAAITLTTFQNIVWNEPFYAQLGFIALERGSADPRLQDLLNMEVAVGFPGDQCCTMRLPLMQTSVGNLDRVR